MKISAVIVVLLAAAACSPAAADQAAAKYTLRYKFQPGESLRWEVIQRARIVTTVSGSSQTAETVSQSVKAWKVQSVAADGSATFEHAVESVDMSQKLTGVQEVRYNSKKDPKAPYGFQTVAESIGKPLSEVTISTTGEILHRKRYPVRQAGENDNLMTIPLPAGPVAVGEVWTRPSTIDISQPGGLFKKIDCVQKFALEEVRDDVAVIRVSTTVLTPVRDPSIEAQIVQRETAGTVRFDIDAGRVIGQQMDVDKQVVGFRGEASSLHYLSRFTEELLPGQPATASVEKPAAPKPR